MSLMGAKPGSWLLYLHFVSGDERLSALYSLVRRRFSSSWLSDTGSKGPLHRSWSTTRKSWTSENFHSLGGNRRDRRGVRGTRKMLKYFPFGLLIWLPKNCLPDGEDQSSDCEPLCFYWPTSPPHCLVWNRYASPNPLPHFLVPIYCLTHLPAAWGWGKWPGQWPLAIS